MNPSEKRKRDELDIAEASTIDGGAALYPRKRVALAVRSVMMWQLPAQLTIVVRGLQAA
jgi:hypothetical protein